MDNNVNQWQPGQNMAPQQNIQVDYYAEIQKNEGKKKLRRRFASGLLVGVLVTCALFGGTLALVGFLRTSGNAKTPLAVTGDSDYDAQGELLNEDTLEKIETLEDVIDTYYYKDEIDKEAEAVGLYRGLMDSLGDPYSVYYTQEELEELMSDTAGIYYGIGAYVSIDEELNLPRISGIIPGTPAEKAELMPDDIISEVDKVTTQGLELSDVVAMIKGAENTSVHLTILRGSDREVLEIDVERSAVVVPTVNSKLLGEKENIGYIQITEFDEVTPDQFAENLAELRESNIEGLIIDLRSNPGGSLTAVCEIARQLLPKGVIVYTMDRNGNREDYNCDGKHEIDIPVVVLVNQYSASASEILAGAIKDYEVGTLVGTTTFGKGIVQRIFDFQDGTAIKLTVSSYYTPNGVNIHGIGIEPDVEIEYDADAYAEDKTDNQLNKGVEVMQDLIDN